MLKFFIMTVLAGAAYGANCTAISLANGATIYNPPSLNGEYLEGTSAHVLCNLGFNLQGTASTFCRNGAWQGQLGECRPSSEQAMQVATQCPSIILPSGRVSYSVNGTDEWHKPEGSTLSIACERGFELEGSPNATCLKGVWTPTLGVCKLKICTKTTPTLGTCTAAAVPNGASVKYLNTNSTDAFPSGTLAVMNCSSGYPAGPAAASCVNGTWVPATFGTCLTTAISSAGKCSGIVAFNGQVAYSDPDIFKIEKDTGTVATLTCFPNMIAEGPTASYCQNGTWTPELGACFARCA